MHMHACANMYVHVCTSIDKIKLESGHSHIHFLMLSILELTSGVLLYSTYGYIHQIVPRFLLYVRLCCGGLVSYRNNSDLVASHLGFATH